MIYPKCVFCLVKYKIFIFIPSTHHYWIGLSISRKHITTQSENYLSDLFLVSLRRILPGKSTFNFRLERTRGEKATFAARNYREQRDLSPLSNNEPRLVVIISLLSDVLSRENRRFSTTELRYLATATIRQRIVVNRLAADFSLTSAPGDPRSEQTRGQKSAKLDRGQSDEG